MSGSVELTLWLHEYKMDALSIVLEEQGTSVEKRMQEMLIDLYSDLVPFETQQEIRARIDAEYTAAQAEASRRFSVFRVTQDGHTDHLITDGTGAMDMLRTATTLRSYLLAKGNSTQRFAERLHNVADIAPEVFQDYADELMQRTGRVTAALDIDLDRGEFSTLDAVDGWETYTIRDVCSAAWHANHNDSLDWAQRIEIFAGRLEHLGIAPPERLSNEKFEFQEQPEAAPFEQTM